MRFSAPVKLRPLLITAIAAILVGIGASAASAHGFSSVAYVDAQAGENGVVRSELQLEYDLLVVSSADAEGVDALFQDGIDAFEYGDAHEQAAAIEEHLDTVQAYIADRYVVTSASEECTVTLSDSVEMTVRQDAPYVVLLADADCASAGPYTVTSTLFADDEGYVTGAETILEYDLGGHAGSAALDAENPTFSTDQGVLERMGEFFILGAEHLLFGIDHILFLLALIVGSRRLREVVITATAFTVAHSVTFILAATGLVVVPAWIVEPIIALSIAAVGAWYLWRLWSRRSEADTFDSTKGRWGLDRAGWLRVAGVFAFGLVHGLGFAGALGIDEPWSWTLLWSLLVFNVGIEAVQIAIIVILFPLLSLLRRRAPRTGRWVTGIVALAVAVMGLIWFVERILGL